MNTLSGTVPLGQFRTGLRVPSLVQGRCKRHFRNLRPLPLNYPRIHVFPKITLSNFFIYLSIKDLCIYIKRIFTFYVNWSYTSTCHSEWRSDRRLGRGRSLPGSRQYHHGTHLPVCGWNLLPLPVALRARQTQRVIPCSVFTVFSRSKMGPL